MKFKWPHLYGLSIVIVFVAGIFLFDLAGYWQTSGKVDGEGNKVEVTGKNIDEIKGWMTLEDVLNGYGLEIEDLEDNFQIEKLDSSKALKDLAEETDEKISPSTLKEYLTDRDSSERND